MTTAPARRSSRRTLGGLREEVHPGTPTPYGWAPLAVLFLVGLVDRIEFQLVSGALPLLQEEWGFSDKAAGAIPTAAAAAAAILSIPAGYVADRYDRRRIIAIVVAVWAVATLGSGLATGFGIFFLWRVLLGGAEAIDNPAAGSLLADYYPPVTRATAYGWTRVTTYLGGVGTILGGVLGDLFGWRAAFLVMAVPGVLVALLVWRLHEPERGYADRLAAASLDAAPPPARPAKPPVDVRRAAFRRQLAAVLRIRSLVIVALGLMVNSMGLAGIYYFMPTLLVRRYDLEVGEAAGLGGLLTIIGVLSGTLLGTRLGRKYHGAVPGARLLIGGSGIVAGAAVLPLALSSDSVPVLAVLLLLSSGLGAVAIPNLTAALADVLPAATRGLGFAVLQVMLTTGLALGPLVVGAISDSTGSLTTAMLWMVPAMAVGGIVTLACRGAYDRDAREVLEQARAGYS